MMITLVHINNELKKCGFKETLSKINFGRINYFYFSGGNSSSWPSNIVDVPRLTDLSLVDWIEKHKHLSENN